MNIFLRRFILFLPIFNLLFGQLPTTTIAVIDFTSSGVTADVSRTISNVARTELLMTAAYTVVERELMSEILTEQGFQQSGCTTRECVVEVGKLLGVQKMMSGSINKLGELFILDIQVTDIATGEIEALESMDFVGRIEELPQSVRALINRIVLGKAIQSEGTVVYVTSDPLGAKVDFNSIFVGNTPLKTVWEKDQVVVRVSQDGFSPWEQTNILRPNETNIIEAQLISNAPANAQLGLASLKITADKDSLDLYVDGGFIGMTPVDSALLVMPGAHEISFFSPQKRDDARRNHEGARTNLMNANITESLLAFKYKFNVKKLEYDVRRIEIGTKKIFVKVGKETNVVMKWQPVSAVENEKTIYIRHWWLTRIGMVLGVYVGVMLIR